MKNKPGRIVLVASLLMLVVTQCQKTAQPTQPVQQVKVTRGGARADIRIVVVSHGRADDAFWSVVKRGVDQAAQETGVQVDYEAPETFDMAAMSQLIDEAVASEPDGLVVSLPDAEALSPFVTAAIDAGIPVISMNSGSDVAAQLGVLAHVGQEEYEAGFGGGRRMAVAGAKNILCVNQEVGNSALDQRCEGLAEALARVGAASDTLAVDPADPAQLQERILMALQAIPDVDGILALGPSVAEPILEVLKREGLLDRITLATFDLTPQILQAIRDGDVLFAIDQQQYLQGYLPIIMLTLYITNANTPGDVIMRTGPGFVTKDNVDQVIELSVAGTR